MRTVLVADDDSHIREVICFALRRSGFDVVEADDGRATLDQFMRHQPDLVILDILMPEMDGLDVCRTIRSRAAAAAQGGNVPILFLSSKDAEPDRIAGLDAGGDDYITKPFSPRELVARVNAQFRRADALASPTGNEISAGPLHIDLDAQTVTVDGVAVELTRTEFGLLTTLVSRRGKVCDRDALMAGAYAGHRIVSDRTIDSHIRRLRAKLREAGLDPIETVHGSGFKLAVP